MLSRVAERVYWAGRYLERIENTARLIGVYDRLMYDLPPGLGLGWYNLIAINSGEEDFQKRYKTRDESSVVNFLLGDTVNSSSLAASMRYARENLRTTRDVIPAESWELINELNMFVTENLKDGIARGQRFNFLDGVIKHCQQIRGLIVGCMPRDYVWCFLQMGRYIERADMTTRILEAGVRAQIQLSDEAAAVNGLQIVWGHVLRSLDADQSYRRTVRTSIRRAEVARYILEDPAFPRTIAHCLQSLIESFSRLPHHDPAMKLAQDIQKRLIDTVDYSDLGEPMKNFLNEVQLDLASVHTSISSSWFTYE